MKKTILIITLAAVLGLLAVGCHDEPVNPSPSVRNVGYIACGDQHQVSVNGDESWHALLDSLFAAAESGCKVTFWNPNAFGSKQADTVTINTADRQQAYRWGEEMYDQGYIVSIVYDENTGTYRGTAIKSTSQPNAADYNVTYITCRQRNDTTINDGESILRLMDSLLIFITDGNCDRFTFCKPTALTLGHSVIDALTIRTSDRQQAIQWGKELYDQDYVVAFWYMTIDSVFYYCHAEKSGTFPPVFTTITPVPLAEYLPGTWVLDGKKLVWPSIDNSDSDWYYRVHEWHYEGGFEYANPDTLVITGTELYSNCQSACNYSIIDSLTILLNAPAYIDLANQNGLYTRVFQIDQDSMLLHMYCTCRPFSYIYTTEFWGDFTYLFVRQH